MPFWPDRFHVPTVRSGTAAAPFVPFVGALDLFQPDYAYSHWRALVSSFEGNILQAKRTSDDAPYYVAVLSNGEGDIAGLQSFVGSGTATVASLTEQMGTGYSLIQPTGSLQRIIVDAGSLLTVGGKAASRGLSNPGGTVIGGVLRTSTFTTYTGTVASLFLRGSHGTYTGYFAALTDLYFGFAKSGQGSSPGRPGFGHLAGGGIQVAYVTNTAAFLDDYLLSFIWDGTNLTIRDGVNTFTAADTASFDINMFALGSWDATNDIQASDVNNLQEAAVWLSDQTANEAAIRSALMA